MFIKAVFLLSLRNFIYADKTNRLWYAGIRTDDKTA